MEESEKMYSELRMSPVVYGKTAFWTAGAVCYRAIVTENTVKVDSFEEWGNAKCISTLFCDKVVQTAVFPCIKWLKRLRSR